MREGEIHRLLTRYGTGCLFPVLSEPELCEIPTVQTLLQGIVDSHLNYALSLQEDRDRQQQPQPVNQEESQDEYGQFDLNWDDPRVLAALDSTVEPRPPSHAADTTMQYTYQSIVEVRRRGFSAIDRTHLTSCTTTTAYQKFGYAHDLRSFYQGIREKQTTTTDDCQWRRRRILLTVSIFMLKHLMCVT